MGLICVLLVWNECPPSTSVGNNIVALHRAYYRICIALSLAFVCYTSRPQKTAVGLLTLSFVSLYNWLHATPEATKIFTAPASLTILWWKPGGAGRIAQVVEVPEGSTVTMAMRGDRVRIVATRDGNVARVPIVGEATTAICTTLQHSCQLHSPRERTKERQPTKGGKQSGWVLGRSAE